MSFFDICNNKSFNINIDNTIKVFECLKIAQCGSSLPDNSSFDDSIFDSQIVTDSEKYTVGINMFIKINLILFKYLLNISNDNLKLYLLFFLSKLSQVRPVYLRNE